MHLYALMRRIAAMQVEGVDMSVRNSVCLRIIVRDLANVTLTIFHE